MQVPPPSLLHATRVWLADSPGLEAAVFGESRLDFGDLAAHACALATTLREMGATPGTRVATLLTPRPEAVIALLACWLVGATSVGINPRYKRDEQRQILVDSQARLMISMTRDGARDLSTDLDDHAATLGIGVLRLGAGLWDGSLPRPIPREAVLARWDAELAGFDPDIPAVVIYTSGSTGRPKGALITHAGLAFRSWSLHMDRYRVPQLRQLLDLPVNHIGALASGIGVSLVAGGTMVMAEQFDPAFTLAVTARERLDVLSGVPAMLGRIVEHVDFAGADLRSLKFVNWGAGPIGRRVLECLLESTSALFTQQYGMTESNGPIVYTPPTRDLEVLLATTGKPDPRLRLRIADAEDRPVPTGTEGEVQVLQPHPFAGYLGNPEATAAVRTADGYLRTGDIAKIRDDGYLVFCGRSKEMLKSGGYNVYPREIEILIETHPAVRAAAVIGIDDPDWGQVGHAFIELKEPVPVTQLMAWCRERLANYKVPKVMTLIDVMPRTTVDKVDRVALAKRLAAD
ncbi:MAG: class I adenylate-forming enzyme family protein [Burkholderiaceae bacterium]